MSTSILRRNSSIKRLQNLERLTTQRSLEDAEEIQRERRRRSRASSSAEPQARRTPQDLPRNAQNLDNQAQNDLLPRCPSSLEEDEGFSDWTQQLSMRRQRQKECEDIEPQLNGSHHSKLCSSSAQSKLHQSDGNVYEATSFKQMHPPLTHQKNTDEDDEKDWGVREEERRDHIHLNRTEKESRRWREEDMSNRMKDNESLWRENQRCDKEKKSMEETSERKISFTSSILLQQNGRLNSNTGAEGMQGNERLQRSMDSPVDSGDLCSPESVSEDVFVRGIEETHQHRDTGDQVQRRMIEEERDRRRRDVIEKLKRLSISSGDPDEPFSPLSPKSPAFMAEGEECHSEGSISIAERTESLNRSIKKRNSMKKTQPPTIISKLDGRLEQYTHAVEECSKEGNAAKQPQVDVLTAEEPVSARRNLFEAGEAWNQTSGKTTFSKDTEGIKVGVSDLINQWVKGNSDDSCKNPSSKTQEIKAGEVHSIKSIWENMGETSPQEKPHGKGSGGKKYKFVISGHGKYEKVLIEDDTN